MRGGITRKFIGTAEPGRVPAAPSTRLVSLPSSSPTLEYRRHHEVEAPEISERGSGLASAGGAVARDVAIP
jgi:hypothetical protein